MKAPAIQTAAKDCPTGTMLEAWLDGNETDADCIETHLQDCQHCLKLVCDADRPSDVLIQSLSAGLASPDDEAALQQLQHELLRSRPEIDSAALLAELRQETRASTDPVQGRLPFDLGNYRLISCIGRGASGAVYRARHKQLERDVAVKVLSADSDAGRRVAMFLEEMKHAGQLSHPNIIRATDAGKQNDLHFLVMEYIEGIDASRLLRLRGPLAVAEVCEIVRQTALGLHFAHEHGFVHRDVKPANILLTIGGEAKLLDLGLATRRFDSSSDPLGSASERNRPAGTAHYMAPEQWDPAATVDAYADTYGLGCTLLRLLTGQLPTVDRNAPADRFAEIQSLLAEVRPTLPRGLVRLIAEMMAHDPRDRPTSSGAIAMRLARWSRGANLASIVRSVCGVQAVCGTTESSLTPSASIVGRGIRKRWTRRAAIGTAAAAGVAAMGGFSWRPRAFAPRLERTTWRDLTTETPELMLSLEDGQAIDCETFGEKVTVGSKQLALLALGRPVVSAYRIRVALQQPTWQGDLGLFFNAESSDPENEAKRCWTFQSIDLRPPHEDPENKSHRLIWSHWRVEAKAGIPIASREPWAETPVAIRVNAPSQQLTLTVGQTGMPEVGWNGARLHPNRWKLSAEGRRRISWSADRLPQAFLGQLGLLNLSGTNTFLKPQLAYL